MPLVQNPGRMEDTKAFAIGSERVEGGASAEGLHKVKQGRRPRFLAIGATYLDRLEMTGQPA